MCQRPIQTLVSLQMLLHWQKLVQPTICDTCWQQFTQINHQPLCPQCGRVQDSPVICYDCRRWQQVLAEPMIKNRGLFIYDTAMHDFMVQYKFRSALHLAAVFTEKIAQTIAQQAVDLVVPMPVAETTFTQRGFNQTIALLAQCPNVVSALAVIDQAKGHQVRRNRQNRMSVQQPFGLVADLRSKLRNKRVLIFDDVYTTGRTMQFAVQAIRPAQPLSITALTLAR